MSNQIKPHDTPEGPECRSPYGHATQYTTTPVLNVGGDRYCVCSKCGTLAEYVVKPRSASLNFDGQEAANGGIAYHSGQLGESFSSYKQMDAYCENRGITPLSRGSTERKKFSSLATEEANKAAQAAGYADKEAIQIAAGSKKYA